jgi:hypothetical protein
MMIARWQTDAHKKWSRDMEPYVVSGSARWEIYRARVIMKADHDMIVCFDLSETHHDYEAPTCRLAVRRIFNLLRIINEGTE